MTRVDFDCKGSRAKQELDCVGRKNPNSNIEPYGIRKWKMNTYKSPGTMGREEKCSKTRNKRKQH